MNKNYKIVFLDIDNTLYPNDTKIIPESTIKAVKEAQDNGVLISLATGRNLPLSKLSGVMDVINFDYMVLCNGALVLDKNLNIVYGDPMSKESIQKILDESTKCDCNVVFHTYNDFFCYNNNFDMAFTGLKTFNIDVPDVKPLKDDVYMLNLFLDDKDVKPFMDLTPEFTFIRLRGLGYDIIKNDVNKATGIANLIKKIGISQDEVIAIGDGLNDIEMIDYAGLGISMGNGVKELKEKANYITSDVNDNGIYNAFKYFNLIK